LLGGRYFFISFSCIGGWRFLGFHIGHFLGMLGFTLQAPMISVLDGSVGPVEANMEMWGA
jgi:hypothetical protein